MYTLQYAVLSLSILHPGISTLSEVHRSNSGMRKYSVLCTSTRRISGIVALAAGLVRHDLPDAARANTEYAFSFLFLKN